MDKKRTPRPRASSDESTDSSYEQRRRNYLSTVPSVETTLRDTEAAIPQASSTIGCQKGKDKQTPASNSNLGESSGRPLEVMKKHNRLTLNCACKQCLAKKEKGRASSSVASEDNLEPAAGPSGLVSAGQLRTAISAAKQFRPSSRIGPRQITFGDFLPANINSSNQPGPSSSRQKRLRFTSESDGDVVGAPKRETSNFAKDQPPAKNAKNVPNPIEENDPPERKRAGRFTKRGGKDKRPITVVKCTLQKIFKRNADTRNIIATINDMCLRTTQIAVLGSLSFLDFVNRSVDNNINIFDTYLSQHIINHFQAARAPTSRSDFSNFFSPQFRTLLQQHNIIRPSNTFLNNSFKYMCQMYETNFFTNIKTHAKIRFTKLLKLWFLEDNNNTNPNKVEYNALKRAADFAFNYKSRARRNAQLIDRIVNYLPDHLTNELDSTLPGFMRPLLFKNNWFRMVPIFIKIQRNIDTYHRECRQQVRPIRVGNFNVVPVHTNLMKYTRIDTMTFKGILEHLKIHPTKPSAKIRGKRVMLQDNEFNDNRDEYWFEFLDRKVIRKITNKDKEFDYQFVTDGISVSVVFRNNKPPNPKTFEDLQDEQQKKYAMFGTRYDSNEYGIAIGLDPGYKLYIAGVIKNLESGDETHMKITSRKYYNTMKQNIRDRKAKRFTGAFETLAADDRENNYNGEIVSPMSANYMLYIEHRLKFFHRAIALYTTKAYTRLAFDKYVCTQSTMDKIVNELRRQRIDSKRVLIVIGGTQFAANSPIKKYRRCPGIRKFVNYIRKHLDCDVVFADEFNTSQVCGRCQRRFGTTDDEKRKHKRWNSQKHRHRLCSDCIPNNDTISLPNVVNTNKSCKAIEKYRLEQVQTIFHHYANYSYADATNEINRRMHIIGDYIFFKSILQTPYNANNQQKPVKCVWNRDISAARNILIKGICLIRNVAAPQSLQRPIRQATVQDEEEEN